MIVMRFLNLGIILFTVVQLMASSAVACENYGKCEMKSQAKEKVCPHHKVAGSEEESSEGSSMMTHCKCCAIWSSVEEIKINPGLVSMLGVLNFYYPKTEVSYFSLILIRPPIS